MRVPRPTFICIGLLLACAGIAGAQPNYLVFRADAPAIVIDNNGTIIREVPELSDAQDVSLISLSDDRSRLLLGRGNQGRIEILTYDIADRSVRLHLSLPYWLHNLKWLPGSSTRFIIGHTIFGESMGVYDIESGAFDQALWQARETLYEAGWSGYSYRGGLAWDTSFFRFAMQVGRPGAGGDSTIWGTYCGDGPGRTICQLRSLGGPDGGSAIYPNWIQPQMTGDGKHVYLVHRPNETEYQVLRYDFDETQGDFRLMSDGVVTSRLNNFGYWWYGPLHLRLLEEQGVVGFMESVNRSSDSLVLCEVETKSCREVFHCNGGMQNWIPIPADNEPPVADAGQDVAVEASGAAGALISLDGRGSFDPDGDDLTFVWTDAEHRVVAQAATAQVRAPLGRSTFSLVVTDGHGGASSDSVTIIVQDTTPPVIMSSVPSSGALWPPHHQMVPLTIAVAAADIVDPVPVCEVVRVASSEPDNGLGDGDTAPDWHMLSQLLVSLRAERGDTGQGRRYTLHVTCTDQSGNAASTTTLVTVPKSQARK